jgi:hypothetical protein
MVLNKKLIALHKHWSTADSIKEQMLFKDFNSIFSTAESSSLDLIALSKFWSCSLQLCVFYALLYVVVEGYKDNEIHDDKIEELLSNEKKVDYLRRFRNAVFHYQEDPINKKLLDFLEEPDTENWIKSLHKAFEKMFCKHLPIEEISNIMQDCTEEKS